MFRTNTRVDHWSMPVLTEPGTAGRFPSTRLGNPAGYGGEPDAVGTPTRDGANRSGSVTTVFYGVLLFLGVALLVVTAVRVLVGGLQGRTGQPAPSNDEVRVPKEGER